jgi:lipoprotein-anchoring transpeptidase ErfK/SrfK
VNFISLPALLCGALLALALGMAVPAAAQAEIDEAQVEPGYDFKYIGDSSVPPPPNAPRTAAAAPTLTVDPTTPRIADASDDQFDFSFADAPARPGNDPSAAPGSRPVISDDVDLWSTAFTPNDLSTLSEIAIPTTTERWIRVDLSEQIVVAYEGDEPVRGFVVSTGLPDTPTVTGAFRIRTKVRSQTMTGGDPAKGTYYNLANVQWVQYFYAEYGFHGTYWHKNFGYPMSHGCVNMTNTDAKWLFDWAGPEWDGKTGWFASHKGNPGTLVVVHE